MTDPQLTPIDQAFAAMDAAPEDDALRLRFYERIAESELFLALVSEPEGDEITPQTFPVEDQTFVLVFDREERLVEFAEGTTATAVLSGRALAGMIAGQEIGMALNLGAPSSILIPADAVAWLADIVSESPDEVEERPQEFSAPAGLPESLITALDGKLALAAGLARSAYLSGVTYEGGRRSHMLGFVDPVPGAEPSLARAVGEALSFSGIEAGMLDVGFFRASDPVCALLAKTGLRFDLPDLTGVDKIPGSAPGMDPENPPKLR